jgi:hypothetical protein
MSNKNLVFRLNKESIAGILIEKNAVSIVGDSRHLIVCDEKGTTIKGPVSIVADAMGIRTGGLFVGVNDFTDMIPSTIVTPVPKKIPFPPIFAVANLAQDVAFFMALLV